MIVIVYLHWVGQVTGYGVVQGARFIRTVCMHRIW